MVTIFSTTFSEQGYKAYGYRWIETFLKYVSSDNVFAKIYVDFPLTVDSDKIEIVNYDKELSSHKSWLNDYKNLAHKNNIPLNRIHEGIKFSFKMFVIIDLLEKYNDDYVVWLDGDCVFKENSNYENFAPKVLNNNFMACQIDKGVNDWRNEDHIESGILVFNTRSLEKTKFLFKLKENYQVELVSTMQQPFDGFILCRTLKQTGVSFVDLFPQNYKMVLNTSDHTFFHPELKSRFRHDILFSIDKPRDYNI